MEVENWCVVVYLRVTFFNDLFSKVYINLVPSKSILLSGNDFYAWNWVLFLTEESFWSILRNENGVLIPLVTELDEPFCVVDGVFKLSVDKLITIRDLLPWKTTESMGYSAIRSY